MENILSWQDSHGSWPKNTNTDSQTSTKPATKLQGTFDNSATSGEMRLLAKAYNATKNQKYLDSFNKALDLIITSQYPNGGWPQYYPLSKQYHRHITFNDNCMVNIMMLLRDITIDKLFDFIDADRRLAAKSAFDKGIDCILKCQIKVNNNLTVWCAQHDEIDLSPRPARSYEPASLSGGESYGILNLLMTIDNPSPEVVNAVNAGIQWYSKSIIDNIGFDRDQNGDKIVINSTNAPTQWARFYEIETNKPIFLSRDGIVKYNFNDIEADRRNGYAWYGNWGSKAFKAYKKWKWARQQTLQMLP